LYGCRIGFETSLADPESGSTRSRQLLVVSKAACLCSFFPHDASQFLRLFLVGW